MGVMGKKGRKLYGYNLETGERKEWGSMSEASREIKTTVSYITVVMREHRPLRGWCLSTDEDEALAIYDNGGKYEKPTHVERPRGARTVPLRIDARTIIWVHPDEANEVFARRYKRILEGRNDD